MPEHPIVHVDFPAEDRARAATFYGDVFGWQSQDFPEMSYTVFQAANGPGGGFAQASESRQPGQVHVFIGTDDIKGTLAQVEAHGGAVVMPPGEIPGNMGWLATFRDPEGNVVGLYSQNG